MAWIICKYGSGGGGGGDRPDGSTVTPVSDVSIWLRCGGLGSKGYTTLSQVLADADTLNGLMSDANAVNYLVRSTSWVSDITSNSSAMTYIGANDYAAFKLLDNSTWSTAIINSTYFASVLTTKVPTMTSATTPSGQVIESGHHNDYYGWKAFDGVVGNALDMWYGNAVPAYCGYKFINPVKVYKWERRNRYNNDSTGVYSPINFQFQGSIDNINWYTINSYSVNDNTSSKLFSYIVNSSSYQYYRIYVTSINEGISSYHQPAVSNLQFYGRTFGDVQSWLKAGKVDKNYTTLEQVLADASTLQALMASPDAVDYLAACGNWASTICANQNAMTYIGLNNYAANTLLNDICWCEAIANSAYIESVLNVKVPTMTGYTTPSGEVIYSSVYIGTYAPWKIFDGNSETAGLYNKADHGYIGYKFTSPKKIYLARIISHTNIAQGSLGFIIQGSTDKTNWIDLTAYYPLTPSGPVLQYDIQTINRDYYSYYRITNTLTGNVDQAYGVRELQLYGRQDV